MRDNLHLSRVSAIALMFVTTCAANDQRPDTGAGKELERNAATAIYQVFSLDRKKLKVPGAPNKEFVFYAEIPDQFENVVCDDSAQLLMSGQAGEVAAINVGACAGQKRRLEQLVRYAPAGFKVVLDSLMRTGRTVSDEQLRQLGLFYEKSTSADGSERHYFPLLNVSHGLVYFPTLVVLAKRGVWVIQAEISRFCSNEEGHKLCIDTMQSLRDIVQHLESGHSRQ